MKKIVLLIAILFSFSLPAGFSAQVQAEQVHSEEQLDNGHLIYLRPEGLDYVDRSGIQPY